VSFRGAVLLCLTTCVFNPGCNSSREPTVQRLYVAPFANLSADPALEWFGRAVSGLVTVRATGSNVQTLDTQDPNATHRMEGYFSESGGVLHVRTAIRDLASQKVVRTAGAQGPSSELLRISEVLVREVAGTVRPYTTSNIEAVRNLYLATSAGSADEVLKHADAAIAADPTYGSAHLVRIQTLVALNRRDEAMQAIEAASGPSVKLTDEERLRLNEARASLTGNIAERARSARDLARLRPGDLQLWRNAAELSMLVKDYPGAIDAYRNALKIEPENIVLWNSLGYAQAYAGDLNAAKEALDQYLRIAPGDANALDSLGEVHYSFGRFAEAEKYFLEAFSKNKALLGGAEALRAAMARLWMGDRAIADQHFARYIDVRKSSHDALVPVREALWMFWTGRRTQAIAALEKLTDPPEAAVSARLLLTLWRLQFGEIDNARKTAADAAQNVKTPQQAAPALVARFLTSTPAAVQSEADGARRQLLGYALLLHQNYAEAARLWTDVYNKTSGLTANEERLLLAWAQAGIGNGSEVGTLLRSYPTPPAGAEPGLASILFPRSIFLKALAEQNANRRDEARRLFKLFLDYSADRDFVYREESRAREAISKP
jgi:tetratricopeptide (TPR) repeat protein